MKIKKLKKASPNRQQKQQQWVQKVWKISNDLLRPKVQIKNLKFENSQNHVEESAEHPLSRAKREGHKLLKA